MLGKAKRLSFSRKDSLSQMFETTQRVQRSAGVSLTPIDRQRNKTEFYSGAVAARHAIVDERGEVIIGRALKIFGEFHSIIWDDVPPDLSLPEEGTIAWYCQNVLGTAKVNWHKRGAFESTTMFYEGASALMLAVMNKPGTELVPSRWREIIAELESSRVL